MRVAWGTPTRHPETEHLGARAFVQVESSNFPGHYEIDTHGRSSADVAATVARLEARHGRLVDRLVGLQDLRGVELEAGGATYRIVGCTIPPRTQEEHVVIIGIRRVDGENLVKVEGWPLRIQLRSIDACPTNEEILVAVTERLGAQTAIVAAHDEFMSKVAAKLSLRA